METIWKYKLLPECEIELPAGSEILTIAAQDGDICMWVKHNLERTKLPRKFRVYGTGHEIDDSVSHFYKGTAFLDGLVFHAFEVA